MLLEHFAIICALLMTVVIQETYVDISPEQCAARPAGPTSTCNAQVQEASVALILCITNVTYCVTMIAMISFRPVESIAYRLYTEFYRLIVVPITLMIFAFLGFGMAFTARVLMQAHALADDESYPSPFYFPSAVLFFAIWPTLCLGVLFAAGWVTLSELKERDLDASGKGFSDAFLQKVGVYPHPEARVLDAPRPDKTVDA